MTKKQLNWTYVAGGVLLFADGFVAGVAFVHHRHGWWTVTQPLLWVVTLLAIAYVIIGYTWERDHK